MKSYLDPLVVAKLSTMFIRAKCVVEGTISGLHSSKFKGQSLEFAQHREYSFGDELKHLDWKIYGKSDRYFIKQYEEETNLRAHILLDASGSMSYRSDGVSKLEYASYVVASLAYLMIKQGDSVGLTVYGRGLKKNIAPRSGLSHLSVILDELGRLSPEGETDISKVLMEFSAHIKKRGLIILISDLLDDPDSVIKSIKNYRFAKHDVMVFHILDRMEEKLDMPGNVLFQHMESSRNIITEPEIIKDEYDRLIAEFIDRYKSEFHKADIDYSYFNTSVPLDKALTQYLTRRSKL